MHYNVTWGRFVQPLLPWKSDDYTYSVCVCVCVCVALVVRHAMRMRHMVMWFVRQYNIFPHYLIKGTIFGEKVTEYKIFKLIFSTTYLKHFFLF